MIEDRNQSATPDDRTREFLRLLSPCEQQLQGYILSMVPSWADAEEIAQETKIRLWEQFDEYDPEKDFGAWARTIAYYQVLTHRKSSRRESARLSEKFVELVAAESAKLSEESDARRSALVYCLKQLSNRHRELIWRCYSGSDTIKDVAHKIGRSVRGTQQSVARIRAILQECIERKVRQEDPA